MESKQGLPILAFASQQEWEEWLDAHHATSKGLWLKIAKKDKWSGVLRRAQQREQVRDPLQAPGRQEARDAGAAHRDVVAMLNAREKLYP